MKHFYIIVATCLLSISGHTQSEDYLLNESEQLLNCISFNYQYQSGRAIHIEFHDDVLTYQWIAGSNKGKPAKTFTYESRLLDKDVYYVQWHEKDQKNFITLVFNLKNRMASSSAIVRYNRDEPITAFEGGIIERVHIKK